MHRGIGVVSRAVLLSFIALLVMGVGMVEASSSISYQIGVQANVAEVIEILVFPDDEINLGDNLIPGVVSESAEQELKVRSNTKWFVTVSDSTFDDGRLRQHAGQIYVSNGHITERSLQIVVEGQDPIDIVQGGVTLASGQGPTGADGKSIVFRFQFEPTMNDPRLTDTVYRIDLVYTVGPGYE